MRSVHSSDQNIMTGTRPMTLRPAIVVEQLSISGLHIKLAFTLYFALIFVHPQVMYKKWRMTIEQMR
jgi:predicted membrane metal-binding protein